ncbi:hypothetical protein VCHC17A1_4016A, partial [Vibrio cholerae HC-17A1]
MLHLTDNSKIPVSLSVKSHP